MHNDPSLHDLIGSQLADARVTLSGGTLSPIDLEFIALIASSFIEPGKFVPAISLRYTEFRVSESEIQFRWPDQMDLFKIQEIYGGRARNAIQFFNGVLGSSATFRKCHFGMAEFRSVENLRLELDDCSFGQSVAFYSSVLTEANIHDCYVRGDMTLTDTVIGVDTQSFSSNHVNGEFAMHACEMLPDTSISHLECDRLMVSGSTFRDRSGMAYVDLANGGYFKSCEFDSDVFLHHIKSESLLSVPGLVAGDRASLDLTSANDEVAVVDCTFGKMSEIRTTASRVNIDRCDFPQGGSIFLETGLGELSRLRSGDPLEVGQRLDELGRPLGSRPRVHSIQNMDMRHVELSNLDLSSAIFQGVRNLSDVRINSGVTFAGPIYDMAARRRMLANEVQWRKQRFARPRSYSLFRREVIDRPLLREIEQYYRALRKGLEDAGDQPGAADFYYGEMEMRRCRSVGWERLLLQAYWAVSGYGLRAWRSAAALVSILSLGTILLWLYGFGPSQSSGFDVTPTLDGQTIRPRVFDGPRPDFPESVVFVLRSATSLTRPGTLPPLTSFGHVVEILVRILAPVLFALSALAIRARVRR